MTEQEKRDAVAEVFKQDARRNKIIKHTKRALAVAIFSLLVAACLSVVAFLASWVIHPDGAFLVPVWMMVFIPIGATAPLMLAASIAYDKCNEMIRRRYMERMKK